MAANNAMGGTHLALYSYDALVSNIEKKTGIIVSQRDLAQPSGKIVEALYIQFIRAIFAMDFEDYLQDLYHLPEQQYAEGFVLKIVQRYLRNIMHLTSGTSWTEGKTPVFFDRVRISDITDPQPARTKVILSSLITFLNLHDGELDFYEEVVDRLKKLGRQRSSSIDTIEKLKEDIERQKAKAEKKRGVLEEEQKKKEEREQEIAETERARKKAKQELKEIKNQVTEKRTTLEEIRTKALEFETKKLDLSRKLVKSPERVRSEITDKTDEVQDKKEVVQSREEAARSLRGKLEMLQQIEKDCQLVRKHLQTLEEVLNDRGEQQALVGSIMEELEKQKIAYNAELADQETWEQRGEGAKERLASLEVRTANERQDLATKTAEANAEYTRATKEREQADTRIDGESRQALELEKEITIMIADHELAIREALGDYWRLMKQADEYIATIAKRLQLPLPTA
ncbi:hypothetical protein M408DRAFT_16123 [Serendipita vermifera MAFF 305830]|uniref:Uncharacterized protein n=1 Tax=Serendipita vermifera MAFF 305830 TaxID=933852 RepID=A0A0C3B9C4_SERVB|nr:hypothetical protein M408DRAFT_16123 [Serendipita vermifera MAFF 305830]